MGEDQLVWLLFLPLVLVPDDRQTLFMELQITRPPLSPPQCPQQEVDPQLITLLRLMLLPAGAGSGRELDSEFVMYIKSPRLL